MSEFDIIKTYFLPLALNRAEVFDFANDTAILPNDPHYDYVISTDSLHEGLHFFAETPADIIAQKALRSNLSDIYASGADPVCYQLALSLPQNIAQDHEWLSLFTDALLADQQATGLYCAGGDTTGSRAGVSITITIIGRVPKGHCITRSGAQKGDAIVVSGTIGKGYQAYRDGRTIAPPLNAGLGRAVQEYANAACDVSDGLLADLAHIAKASALGAVCNVDDIPVRGDDAIAAITGGDDYEAVMAVPQEKLSACISDLIAIGCQPAAIGIFDHGTCEISVLNAQGNVIQIDKKQGWQHF